MRGLELQHVLSNDQGKKAAIFRMQWAVTLNDSSVLSEQWKPRVSLHVLTRPCYTSIKRDPVEKGAGKRKAHDVSAETPSKNKALAGTHITHGTGRKRNDFASRLLESNVFRKEIWIFFFF